MKLMCKRCGYDWEYKGHSSYWTSCPRCRSNVSLKNKDGGKNVE